MKWLLLLLIPLIWALIANTRTLRQRLALIDRRPRGGEFRPYSDEFERVSYEEHFWRVLLFRDPRELYGPLNRQLFR